MIPALCETTLKLMVYRDQALQSTIRLEPCGCRILGSGDDAHVTLESSGVSRLHCLIETDATARSRIQDLGSRNGTKINGRKINESTELASGDLIQIGAITIVVVD